MKSSVYVLPNTPETREDLEWVKEEIVSMKGEATLFEADGFDSVSEDEIIAAFRHARQEDYAALRRDAKKLSSTATAGSRMARSRTRRRLKLLRKRLAEVTGIDFFGAGGREEVSESLDEIERSLGPKTGPESPRPPGGVLDPREFRGRLWVTRPRPGIDRMGSAWLIRRFIDPGAKFGFAAQLDAPPGVIPFDMFGVELGHQGDRCTMETLVERFAIRDAHAASLARIVHQIDLKDESVSTLEAPAMARLVEGLRMMYREDRELLERGIALFEALYLGLGSAAPRAEAGGRTSRSRRSTAGRKK